MSNKSKGQKKGTEPNKTEEEVKEELGILIGLICEPQFGLFDALNRLFTVSLSTETNFLIEDLQLEVREHRVKFLAIKNKMIKENGIDVKDGEVIALTGKAKTDFSDICNQRIELKTPKIKSTRADLIASYNGNILSANDKIVLKDIIGFAKDKPKKKPAKKKQAGK